MRVTISKTNNIVAVDGEFLEVCLDALGANLSVVHWDGTKGHEEWTNKDNTEITSITPYQSVIDAWLSAKDALLASLIEPVKTDEEIEAEMWTKIKVERDRRQSGGFKVEITTEIFKWFHSDPTSRLQQLGLVIAGAAVPEIPWKTMDGSFATMTPTIAGLIFQAGLTLDTALFAIAEQHKYAMEQSAEPSLYDYSTGWPEMFGE
jgi:hypothetical protein